MCNCNVDNRDGKNCGYAGSYSDITHTTHHNDNGYYSYIIYKNNDNGKSMCESSSHDKANTYIQNICINGNRSSSPFEYHGWYWYKGSGDFRDASTKGFQSGWYVNGSNKQRYGIVTSIENICEKACASKY